MRYVMSGVLCALAILAQTALAGEIREIELNDGSVITGELLSLSNGIYTIKSGSLGTVRIEETKIRTVRPRTVNSSGSRQLTDRMMNDAEIMTMIQGLQDDPDFKKVLADPEILQAVKDNDLTTLMSKPEFMKLLDKPTVRNIQEKVK